MSSTSISSHGPAASSFGLASASGNSVQLWNVTTLPTSNSKATPPSTYSPTCGPLSPAPGVTITDLAWSGDYKTLAAGTDSTVYLYDTTVAGGVMTDVLLAPPPPPDFAPGGYSQPPSSKSSSTSFPIRSVSLGWRSSRHVFMSSGPFIHVYDRKDQKFTTTLTGHKSNIQSIALTTDDQRCASSSSSGDVLVHSFKNGGTQTQLTSPFTQSINSVSFYHFKKSVIGGVGDDGGIALWDINHSREPMLVKENSHAGPIKQITFAPCNKHLYCTVGLDKVLQFHDIQQKTRVLQSFTAEHPFTCLSMNDDHTVAAGTTHGDIIIYDIRYKGVVTTWQAHNRQLNAIAFQPPKWAIDASIQRQDRSAAAISGSNLTATPSIPGKTSSSTLSETAAMQPVEKITMPKAASTLLSSNGSGGRDYMDMFSPVKAKSVSSINLVAAAVMGSVKQSATTDINESTSNHEGNGERHNGHPGLLGRSISALSVRESGHEDSLVKASDTKNVDSVTSIDNIGVEYVAASKETDADHALTQSPLDRRAGKVNNALPSTLPTSHSDVKIKESLDGRSGEPLELGDPRQKLFASGSVASATDVASLASARPVQPGGSASSDLSSSTSSLFTPSKTAVESLKEKIKAKVSMLHSNISAAPRGGPTPSTPGGGLVSAISANHPHGTPMTPIFTSGLALSTPAYLGGDEQCGGLPMPAAGAIPTGSFQYQVLENVIEDVMIGFRDEMTQDLQNMHLELLRQFDQQKSELERLFERYSPSMAMLYEIEQLREENARLRAGRL